MNLSTFFDLFPPPRFLNIPYVGLSISDTSVKYIQFGKSSTGLYVKKYGEKQIPSGAVISGFINNADEVVHVLEEVKKEIGEIFCKVSLPEEKAYLFSTTIPRVAPHEVRSTIEFSIEDNVPLPASELIFDYAIPGRHGHKDHVDVIVSAFPTTIIDRYVETFNRAGISLLSLEIESQAISRALLPNHDHTTRLIMHFGSEKVGLYVVYRRIVHFTSTIILKNNSRDDLSLLSQEIKRLYLYWHTLKENVGEPDRQISQIILCGEDVNLDIASSLSAKHHTPAVIGNVWQNVLKIEEVIPSISHADSLRYGASIGLALPSDILI
jgi:Tfp pilus assembly PilM family ATPase